MISEILISTALSLANDPMLCTQKKYDALYRNLVQIDLRLGEIERQIRNKCTADFKSRCVYSPKDTERLEFFRTFRYDAVMAMRRKCNGMLSTWESDFYRSK